MTSAHEELPSQDRGGGLFEKEAAADPSAEPGADPGLDAGADPGVDPGDDSGVDAGADPGVELGDVLVAAQQALAERTVDLQRLQAEYVNYKRRVDRDRELVKQNAVYSAVTAFLPVLDDIARAREHGEVEGGFKAVADALDRTVAGMGLIKFGEPGDAFDPNIHEALMHAHSPDVTTTTCQHVIQAGYRIGDRVVRPARVTVVDPEPTVADASAEAE